MLPVIIRTLLCEIRVWPCDEAAANAFAFVRAAPNMGEPASEPIEIAIEPLGSFYRMALPDGSNPEGSLQYLVSRFGRFLGAQVERETGRYPLLRAASVVCERSRGLLIGSAGSGKTALVLRLMMEGGGVEGDEVVIVREKDVLAVPRTLRVRQPALRFAGPLADAIVASPSSEDWHDRVTYSVDPSICGKPWHIDAGPAKLLIFLEPNHGGTSILTSMGREEAFAGLVDMSLFPKEARGAAAAALRMAAIRARCLKLSLGDLDRAVWHLRRAFSEAGNRAPSS